MVKLVNCGSENFKERAKNINVIVYGAGRASETVIKRYFQDGSIAMLVDSDSSKTGKIINVSGLNIRISALSEMVEYVANSDKTQTAVLISTPGYAAEIINKLDDIPELDGIECYVHKLIKNTREIGYPVFFSKGEQRIPKKIHYIWLGRKKIPEEFEDYIKGWKVINPDYEIIRWDESNYDLSKNDFVREAYEAGAWSRVANYMRLDIIYNHGGIYLDTDVEMIKSVDCLLQDDAFFCMGNTDSINTGCGFGAKIGCDVVKDIMNEYEGKHFDTEKGGVGQYSSHFFLEDAILKQGFEIMDKYQKIKDVVLYPKEVMSPMTFEGMPNFLTKYTVAIHHEKGSWRTKKEKDGVDELSKIIKERLVNE